jgi:asparagine synthase (glutamine-hydrolysing)
VSHLVRANGVKAILSGEGADECFLGYGRIAYDDVRARYRRALSRVRALVQRVPRLGKALWPECAHPGAATELQQNFELQLDRDRVVRRVKEAGLDAHPREYRSLDWLGYHLRTLLHRNDALGMAASIEARFPYLDHDLVRFAVNLPYEYKIRRSLGTLERAHPFLRDKWVLRAVADRYLPRSLSRRRKIGFPTNAYTRARCAPAFFEGGFIADFYRLGERSLAHLLEGADPDLRLRLLMLEAWGRLFFRGTSQGDVTAQLVRHMTIDPVPA